MALSTNPYTGLAAADCGTFVRVIWLRRAAFRSEYGATLAAAQEYRFQVQHSTTGAFAGEETTLTRQMPHAGALLRWRYFTEAGSPNTSLPPLEDQEKWGYDVFYDWAPADGANYYRVRELHWDPDTQTVDETGSWSSTVNATHAGDDLPEWWGVATADTYDPGDLPKLVIEVPIAPTAGHGYDKIDLHAIGTGFPLNGPEAWNALAAEMRNKGLDHADLMYELKDPFGNTAMILDDASGGGNYGYFRTRQLPPPNAPFARAIDPPDYFANGAWADDSTIAQAGLLWWRMLQHENADSDLYETGATILAGRATKLRAIVNDYPTTTPFGLVYLGLPIIENGRMDTDWLLESPSGILPFIQANQLIVIGTGSAGTVVDEVTGLKTGLGLFLDWWAATFPDVPLGLEPGGHRKRTSQIFLSEDYPFLFGWSQYKVQFDDAEYVATQTVAPKTGGAGDNDDGLDPRAVLHRKFMVQVSSNGSTYVRNAGTAAERINRAHELIGDLIAYSPNIIPIHAPGQYINRHITGEQITALIDLIPGAATAAELGVALRINGAPPITMADAVSQALGSMRSTSSIEIRVSNNGGTAAVITDAVLTMTSGTASFSDGDDGAGVNILIPAGGSYSWTIEVETFGGVSWNGGFALTATAGNWLGTSDATFNVNWTAGQATGPAGMLDISYSLSPGDDEDGTHDFIGMLDDTQVMLEQSATGDLLTIRAHNRGSGSVVVDSAVATAATGTLTEVAGTFGASISVTIPAGENADWTVAIASYGTGTFAGNITLGVSTGGFMDDDGADDTFIATWTGQQRAITSPSLLVEYRVNGGSWTEMLDDIDAALARSEAGDTIQLRVTNQGTATATITAVLVAEKVGDVTVFGTTGDPVSIEIAPDGTETWTILVEAASGGLSLSIELAAAVGDWVSDRGVGDGRFVAAFATAAATPALIDTAYIKALIEQALQDGLEGTQVTYVMSGRNPPEGADAWARLVAVDFSRMSRQRRSGETDMCSVVVTVNVAVGAGQTNAHAIDAALRVVADAIDEFVEDAVAANGHLLSLERAAPHADADLAEDPGIRTGHVIAEGVVMRESGLTRVSFLS